MIDMSDHMRVGAIQICSTPDIDSNLKTLRRLTKEAVYHHADFVAWPENAVYLAPEGAENFKVAKKNEERFLEFFSTTAKEHGITLLIGSYPEVSHVNGKFYNTSLLLGPDGEIIERYRKIHLFDVVTPSGQKIQESKVVIPGREVKVAYTKETKIGLSVCYDLRFPELYRIASAKGAEVLTVPAAFTAQTGKEHWLMLLRARAVENLCFVIAPNQWGRHFDNRRSYGRTAIIDPWGVVLGICSDQEGVVLADLNLASLRAIRTGFPCLDHRIL